MKILVLRRPKVDYSVIEGQYPLPGPLHAVLFRLFPNPQETTS